MNVYVRALASALAHAGLPCDVVTRAEHPEQPPVQIVEPGFRVLNIDVGPRRPMRKHDLAELVPEMAALVKGLVHAGALAPDVLHANYWLSGAVGHTLKHELDLPLVATFHTLARVKADAGVDDDPELRTRIEHEIVACADLLLASTADERTQLADLYAAEPERIEVVPPGVDHRVFSPGNRADARRRLGLDARRLLLFAGRIQPLKGVDLAIRCLHCLDDPDTQLVVIGGPSGDEGAQTLANLHGVVSDLGLDSQVRFVRPQPHVDLADWYRAADVCIVPSRSESFGLVALEAAACGTPVVAADVGGLRSLVLDGVTGFLVEEREPCHYAAPVELLLSDAALAADMGARAAEASWRYSWSTTAGRLRRLYTDLAVRGPVPCG